MVAEHHGERHARGLRCWDQFVAMMFCQLGQAQSLREIHEDLNDAQKKVAEAYIRQIDTAGVLGRRIVTQVVPLQKFYTAENYHQDYARGSRANPYIVHVSDPKVEKLKKLYPGCVRKRK